MGCVPYERYPIGVASGETRRLWCRQPPFEPREGSDMLRRLVIACILAAVPASALAASTTAIGPRIGFSTGPDQFVVGGQLSIGEVAPHLTFDPSVDIGLGDNRTLVGLNLDLHYLFNASGDW